MAVCDETVYHMASQPCVGALSIDKLIDKYVCDLDEEKLNSIKQKNSTNSKGVLSGRYTLVCCFTKSGINPIIEDGKIDIIPNCRVEDRKEIIKKIIEVEKCGRYRAHVIDYEKFKLPKGMYIEAYDNSRLVINYDIDIFNKNIFVNERTIADAVYNFMARFEKDVFVYSVEDTVEYLEGLVGEYYDVIAGVKVWQANNRLTAQLLKCTERLMLTQNVAKFLKNKNIYCHILNEDFQ